MHKPASVTVRRWAEGSSKGLKLAASESKNIIAAARASDRSSCTKYFNSFNFNSIDFKFNFIVSYLATLIYSYSLRSTTYSLNKTFTFFKIKIVQLYWTSILTVYVGAFHQLSVVENKLAMGSDLHVVEEDENALNAANSFTVLIDFDERMLEQGGANARNLSVDGFLQVDMKLLFAPPASAVNEKQRAQADRFYDPDPDPSSATVTASPTSILIQDRSTHVLAHDDRGVVVSVH